MRGGRQLHRETGEARAEIVAGMFARGEAATRGAVFLKHAARLPWVVRARIKSKQTLKREYTSADGEAAGRQRGRVATARPHHRVMTARSQGDGEAALPRGDGKAAGRWRGSKATARPQGDGEAAGRRRGRGATARPRGDG